MTAAEQESMTTPVQEWETVRSADDMDLETFCLHMDKRHKGSLGGLTRLDPGLLGKQPSLELAYRHFHDQLHGLLMPEDIEHYHGVSWG